MKTLFLIILTFCYLSVHSQGNTEQYDNEPFAFQVKQIDEFIERFNNAENTLIKKYLDEHYDLEVSRREMILSLFDHRDLDEHEQERAISFIRDIVDSSKPPFLSFYDQDWYARASCLAKYRNRDITFDIVLSVKPGKEANSVNWAIKSLYVEELDMKGDFTFNILLPPSGHGTNFLELRRMFDNPANYYDSSQPRQNFMNQLLSKAESGEFKFMGVKQVTYHFLQLKNWIVKVEEFNRKGNNSGWLISEFRHADMNAKNEYLYEQLHIN